MPWRAAMAEMLGCVQLQRNPPSDMSVFELQQMRLKQQQALAGECSFVPQQAFMDLQMMQLESWQDILQYNYNPIMEQPSSELLAPAAESNTADFNGGGANLISYPHTVDDGGSRKRKTQTPQTMTNVDRCSESGGEKRVKCQGGGGGGAVLRQPKQEDATTTSNNSKQSSDVVQKSDYVHVRARRGQATDSHSLAERARREKISERMKYLQDLVPGCNKIAGKAGMLDEIINYVQSLQRQVEFLSMKLAAANPVLDFGAMAMSQVSPRSVPATPSHGAGLGLALNLQDAAFNADGGVAPLPADFAMDARSFNVAGAGSSQEWETNLQSFLVAASLNEQQCTPNYIYQGAT